MTRPKKSTSHLAPLPLIAAVAAVSVAAALLSPVPAAAEIPPPAPAAAGSELVLAQIGGFGDVADDTYYSVPVEALAAAGVFDGTECGPNLLCPDEPIDRKTMAVWTVRVVTGQDPPAASQTRFADVDADSFYAPFIERMADLRITLGCGDGTRFCPDDTVTRAQMAVFLTRAFSLVPGPDPGFTDVPADAWYFDHLTALAASGITKGCDDGTVFCPGRDTTRAQMATFLYRAIFADAASVSLTAVPGEASAVAFAGRASISWPSSAPEDGSSIAAYEVQWKTGDQRWDPSRRAVVTRPSYAISGLEDGVEYTIRVRPAAVETAEVEGASITAGEGSSPTAEIIENPVAVDRSLEISALDGPVSFEVTGEPVWPASISIPVDVSSLPPGVPAYLMYFDEQLDLWLPVPEAILDLERGVVTARVNSAADFTVIAGTRVTPLSSSTIDEIGEALTAIAAGATITDNTAYDLFNGDPDALNEISLAQVPQYAQAVLDALDELPADTVPDWMLALLSQTVEVAARDPERARLVAPSSAAISYSATPLLWKDSATSEPHTRSPLELQASPIALATRAMPSVRVATGVSESDSQLAVDGYDFFNWLDYQIQDKLLGNRADPPVCTRRLPGWVKEITSEEGINARLLTCGEADDGDLMLRLAANRSYWMRLRGTIQFESEKRASILQPELLFAERLSAGDTVYIPATSTIALRVTHRGLDQPGFMRLDGGPHPSAIFYDLIAEPVVKALKKNPLISLLLSCLKPTIDLVGEYGTFNFGDWFKFANNKLASCLDTVAKAAAAAGVSIPGSVVLAKVILIKETINSLVNAAELIRDSFFSGGAATIGVRTNGPTRIANIPDTSLRRAIRSELDKPNEDLLYESDLSEITHLSSYGFGAITDLTGIQHLVNLERLTLSNKRITDVRPLASLSNLVELNLAGNRITDISPLAKLPKLQRLDLSDNSVVDLRPLAGLTELEWIDLSGNNITGIGPLTDLDSLELLDLHDNRISDLAPLAGLDELETLYLGRNSVSDISPLATLTSLQALYLRNNNISNLGPLTGLRNLKTLDLGYNRIQSVQALTGLTNLEFLYLDNNDITSVAALAALTNLKGLNLFNNDVTDSSALLHLLILGVPVLLSRIDIPDDALRQMITSALRLDGDAPVTTAQAKTLRRLDARGQGIADLAGLEHFTNLQNLNLGGNNISCVAPLGALGNLRFLELGSNAVADIGPLGALTNLHFLSLSGNRISDAAALGSLTRLEQLDLGGNYITDAAPLGSLTRLQQLDLGGNYITDAAPLGSLTRLQQLYLGWNYISDAAPLGSLTRLQQLDLGWNYITDAAPLGSLTRLQQLYLGWNDITDAAPLGSLTRLEQLGLQSTPITSVAALEPLNNLQNLYLFDTIVTDLTPLQRDGLRISTIVQSSPGTKFPDYGSGSARSATDCPPQPDPPTVTIPDDALRQMITSALRLDGDAPVTTAQAKTLRRLDARGQGIADLAGLEHFTNLQNLNLGGNNISCVAPLGALGNLRFLELGSNAVADIGPLGALTNLHFLSLSGNRISDAAALGSLTRLEQLDLGGNYITDAAPLGSLTRLQQLDLGGNYITDAAPLGSLTRLQQLYLGWNYISDAAPLGSLTRLQQLDLGWNYITDAAPLGSLTRLQQLYLGWNDITDAAPLGSLTRLEQLGLQSTPITSVAALEPLNNLQNLYLFDTIVTDLTPLQRDGLRISTIVQSSPGTKFPDYGSGSARSATDCPPQPDPPTVTIPDDALRQMITSALRLDGDAPVTTAQAKTLRRLDARGQGIADLAGLEHFTNLQNLNLGGNNISCVAPLGALGNLRFLELGSNAVADIGPLGALTNLHFLSLSGNRISDAAALGSLTRLEQLDLGGNYITDAAPLGSLTRLQQLDLGGNYITDAAPLGSLTRLQQLYLGWNYISDAAPLGSLTRLQQLDLGWNYITDAAPLGSLTRLQQLYLGWNDITDAAPLGSLTRLEQLGLQSTPITSVAALEPLNNLQNLYLFDTIVTDLTPLQRDGLRISTIVQSSPGTKFPDYGSGSARSATDCPPQPDPPTVTIPDDALRQKITSALRLDGDAPVTTAQAKTLRTLDARGQGIADLAGLEHFTNLQNLNLGGNNISDLRPLATLVFLRTLDLAQNKVTDVNPLAALTSLETLYLTGNPVTDLTPLDGLKPPLTIVP